VAIVLQTFNTSTMRRERCTIFMKREIIRLYGSRRRPAQEMRFKRTLKAATLFKLHCGVHSLPGTPKRNPPFCLPSALPRINELIDIDEGELQPLRVLAVRQR